MPEANEKDVVLYALSTCGWCRMTRTWLDENNVQYECIYVDHLDKDEREVLMGTLTNRLGRRPAFPTVFRGPKFVVGFNKERLKEMLEL